MSISIRTITSDDISYSGFNQTWLLRSMTQSKKIILDGFTPGIDNAYSAISTNSVYPSPGDPVSPGFPNMYVFNVEIVDGWGNEKAPNLFTIVSQCHGTTGKALWQNRGSLTIESSSLDANFQPTAVPPPPQAIAELLQSGDLKKDIIHVARLPRPIGQVMKTFTFYDVNVLGSDGTGRNTGRGEYMWSSKLNTLLGTTNAVAWGPYDPRTWLVSGVDSITDNNRLFKITITFTWRWKTWDEIALWLDENLHVRTDPITNLVSVQPPIPVGNAFPTSPIGFDNEIAPNGLDYTKALPKNASIGWARFKMATPMAWTKTFTFDRDNKPDFNLNIQ